MVAGVVVIPDLIDGAHLACLIILRPGVGQLGAGIGGGHLRLALHLCRRVLLLLLLPLDAAGVHGEGGLIARLVIDRLEGQGTQVTEGQVPAVEAGEVVCYGGGAIDQGHGLGLVDVGVIVPHLRFDRDAAAARHVGHAAGAHAILSRFRVCVRSKSAGRRQSQGQAEGQGDAEGAPYSVCFHLKSSCFFQFSAFRWPLCFPNIIPDEDAAGQHSCQNCHWTNRKLRPFPFPRPLGIIVGET